MGTKDNDATSESCSCTGEEGACDCGGADTQGPCTGQLLGQLHAFIADNYENAEDISTVLTVYLSWITEDMGVPVEVLADAIAAYRGIDGRIILAHSTGEMN